MPMPPWTLLYTTVENVLGETNYRTNATARPLRLKLARSPSITRPLLVRNRWNTRGQTTLVLLYAYPAATLGPKNTTDAFVRTVCTLTLGVLHISIL